MGDELKVYEPNHIKKIYVRSGIRTHAHRSGLRPERSALDLSAILTSTMLDWSFEALNTGAEHVTFCSAGQLVSLTHHRGPFSSVG